jgi:hypothetical protein
MNRRELLQSLSFLPALAPLVRLEESPTKPASVIHDHDWKIRWYGWHQLQTMHALFGYWWARNEKLKLQAASPCPGNITWMFDGQYMDTSVQKDQILITPDTPVLIAEEEQKKALDKLLHFLRTAPQREPRKFL